MTSNDAICLVTLTEYVKLFMVKCTAYGKRKNHEF